MNNNFTILDAIITRTLDMPGYKILKCYIVDNIADGIIHFLPYYKCSTIAFSFAAVGIFLDTGDRC